MRIVTNPALDAGLRERLIDSWVRVANAGGAVGFVAPTSPTEVAPVANAAFDRVAAGRDDLVVAMEGELPVGLGFLQRNDTRLQRHVGVVRRLQRDPSHAGRGVGGAILDALEAVARARDVRVVTLSVRGGTGRERYYLARGYRLDARLPDHVHVGGGQLVDELRLSKRIDIVSPTVPAADTAGGAVHGRVAPSAVALPIHQLDADLPMPRYARPGDAGLDLHAREKVALDPGERAIVATGVAVAVPPGHVGLIHPRSGLALRHGITVVNAPGTIDAGYRGEIKVILANTDARDTVVLDRGDRIAQLIIQPVATVDVVPVDALPDTDRGADGFGSTGT